MDDNLRFLGALPYFRGLPMEDLLHLRDRCHTRTLDHGELIVLEGGPAARLYVVRSGKVRVLNTSPQGKEQVLIVLGPGETFNDVPVFDGGPNLASVQAAAPRTSVWVVPSSLVTHLLLITPRVVANVVRVLAGRLRHLTALVEGLSFRHITQRVAKLLLEESNGTSGAVTLTQQAIAARVGTAREVVSRALRELEDRGAVRREHNRIVQINAAMLRAAGAALAVAGGHSGAAHGAPQRAKRRRKKI